MIENCAVATMDGPRHDQGGTEYRRGHVTVTGDRITAVGEGPAGSVPDGARRIDAGGCLVLGPPAPLELLLVGGTPVVDGGELRTVDAATAAREVRVARLRLADPS